MSLIAMQGGATGTGTVTLLAPITNTNRTLTLPDATGTVLTNATTTGFPAGSVLQVVQGTYSTQTTISSTSFSATGLTASITPTSATSKILVLVSQTARAYRQFGATQACNIKLFRGASELALYIAVRQWVGTNTSIDVQIGSTFSAAYLDSPNTTSSTTYSTQAAADTTAQSGYVELQSGSSPSTITLMEIAA
jgi:hypothetical protein